jgi:peptide/nickel transport system ATP-binding protein
MKLLEVKNCSKYFKTEKGLFGSGKIIPAAENISFSIAHGEITALVGESGSGKSTIGRMIQGLIQPSFGDIFFEGKEIRKISRQERAHFTQMIFQDPFASLNPKLSIGTILGEALEKNCTDSQGPRLLRENRTKKRGDFPHQKSGLWCQALGARHPVPDTVRLQIGELLETVGLSPNIQDHYPHQFSGGQRQRIGIARALAMHPKLLIADEPVSALDLSIQAQILNLMIALNQKYKMALLLITHDLSIVKYMAHQVLVIQKGHLVEQGPTERIFKKPREAYTKKLFSAILSVP